jgi:UDP-N-acetylmuramate--alanine ligase
MKHSIQRIHFVGIGGAGMSGIAQVLHHLGYKISGSDASESDTLALLRADGIACDVGHAAAQVRDAQVLVISSAVKADNPEVVEAKARRIPVVPRAQMLAELMRFKEGIAIAGTHGKTTTTSLVASIFAQAGRDPTFVIGGKLTAAGVNARLGAGEQIIVEADESDASFLQLLPVACVVTNIDADHMETYGHDLAKLHQAFADFCHRMPFWGSAVVCSDDAGVRQVMPLIQRHTVRYGFDIAQQPDVWGSDVRADQGCMRFRVQRDGLQAGPLDITLNLAGEHNVRNALAAIAIATLWKIDDIAIQAALAAFQGVGRRFESYGDVALPRGGSMRVIDDYGHHPVEMRATLLAARHAFPGKRLVLAFQPHRYSRTRDCFDDFVQVMGLADLVLLTEVYAAGESPIAAADGRALAHALRQSGLSRNWQPVFIHDVHDLPQAVFAQARDGDVVLCMGAGSIGQVPGRLRATAGGIQ